MDNNDTNDSMFAKLNTTESFRKSSLIKTPMHIPKLPTLGPLEIDDLEEFLEKSKIDFKNAWNDSSMSEVTIFDFKIQKILGEGAFGKVVLGTFKETGMEYAIKVQDKNFVLENLFIESLLNEKKVLQCMNFPFFVPLDFFFLDFKYIYFVMPFIRGGEFYQYIVKVGQISENDAKFYTSQAVLAIEYLHCLGLAHRDLKLENILLDRTGYIKITDFGLCKRLRGRTWSNVGTPCYMAPEILHNKGYDVAVDWWSIGIIIYEIVFGQPPFFHDNTLIINNMICFEEYYIPPYFSKSLKSLLRKMLMKDPLKRLGNLKNKAKDIKEHRWYKSIDWNLILNRKVKAPYIPKID